MQWQIAGQRSTLSCSIHFSYFVFYYLTVSFFFVKTTGSCPINGNENIYYTLLYLPVSPENFYVWPGIGEVILTNPMSTDVDIWYIYVFFIIFNYSFLDTLDGWSVWTNLFLEYDYHHIYHASLNQNSQGCKKNDWSKEDCAQLCLRETSAVTAVFGECTS